MDIIDLAQQIAEMRGEHGAALERIEARLGEIPGLCYEHRSECVSEREQAEAKASKRLDTLEAAQQPTTVRDVWGWAWRLGAGTAAVSGGALVVRALIVAAW
jgi:hypothetical protein